MSALAKFPLITPFLWFDANAEEAVEFYLSVFPNSRRLSTVPGAGGTVLTIAFELDGQKFTALNGGPPFRFTAAVSFAVRCETQQEVDAYWSNLSAGGSDGRCGWLRIGSAFRGRLCRRACPISSNTPKQCRPC